MTDARDNRQARQDLRAAGHGDMASRAVPVEERRRLVAESLHIGNPGNNARELPETADPRSDCQIELRIDQIREYEHNPRRLGNAKFDEIKGSIRAVGLRIPLTVTRRPGEAHFIVEAGGNTRLVAIQQLWAETRDPRFETVTVFLRPWRSETHVLSAHLIENEQRGDLAYWDKASGIMRLRTELEREQNRTLSLSQLQEELRSLGYTVSKAALGFYAFAVQRLESLGQALPSLTSDGVKRLQQGFNRIRRFAETCHGVPEADLYAEIIDPVLEETGNRVSTLGALDPDAICDQCASALAQYICRPRAEVLSAIGPAVVSATDTGDLLPEQRGRGAANSPSASSQDMPDAVARLVRQFAMLTGIEPLVEWASDTPYGFRLPTSDPGSDPQLRGPEGEQSARAWQLLRCLASQDPVPADTDPSQEQSAETALMVWLLDTDDRSAGLFLDLVGAVRRRRRAEGAPIRPKPHVSAPVTC